MRGFPSDSGLGGTKPVTRGVLAVLRAAVRRRVGGGGRPRKRSMLGGCASGGDPLVLSVGFS